MNMALAVMSVVALSISAGDLAQKKRAKPAPKPAAPRAAARTSPGVTIADVSVIVDSTANERGKNLPARVLVWVKNADTVSHAGSLVIAVGSPRRDTLDSTMVAVSIGRLSARAIPVSLPVSASDPSETLGGFVKLTIDADSTTYGKIETSTIKIPRPRRSGWMLAFVLIDLTVALIGAAVAVVAGENFRKGIETSQAVTWSFSQSWTTNLGAIGTVVAGLTTFLPAWTGHYMSRTEYLAMVAFLGAMFSLAPAAFGLLVNSWKESSTRPKLFDLFAGLCLAFLHMAAFGQLGLIVLLTFEAASAGILTALVPYLMSALALFVAVCVIVAESKSVTKRTELHKRMVDATTSETTKRFVLP